MIPTKINREITRQSVMLRLDYLTSQLPAQDEVFMISRQLGNAKFQRLLQLLMMEIQVTHQRLAMIKRADYESE